MMPVNGLALLLEAGRAEALEVRRGFAARYAANFSSLIASEFITWPPTRRVA